MSRPRKSERHLKEMRKLSGLTQADMARRLDMGQTSVSRFEKGRADTRLSIIRKYVEAPGGTLQVSVAFNANSAPCLHVRDAFDVSSTMKTGLSCPYSPRSRFEPIEMLC